VSLPLYGIPGTLLAGNFIHSLLVHESREYELIEITDDGVLKSLFIVRPPLQ
jgi:hypothetical protein